MGDSNFKWRGQHGKTNPGMRNLLCFQLQVWRYLGSPQPLTWIGLVFWLPAEFDMRDRASIPKEKLCSLLFLPLSNPCAVCPHTLQNSKSTAVTPKHLLGRYWFFPLSISSPDSNKEAKNQGKYKNQSALLWIHTWDSPGLKWDVCLRISEAIIRSFGCCEMSLHCRALIQGQFWTQAIKLSKYKNFLLWLITQLESC